MCSYYRFVCGLEFWGVFFLLFLFVFLINLLNWNKLYNTKYSLLFYFYKLYFPDAQIYQYNIFQTLVIN